MYITGGPFDRYYQCEVVGGYESGSQFPYAKVNIKGSFLMAD